MTLNYTPPRIVNSAGANCRITSEEGWIRTLFIVAACASLISLAHAAPRDAIAYLPQITSYTSWEQQQTESDRNASSGYDRLSSRWQFEWRPATVPLGDSELDWRLRYITELSDQSDYAAGSRNDGSRYNYEYELNLRNTSLDARHAVFRRDTWRAGEQEVGTVESEQITSSGIAVKLPFAAVARVNELTTRNYSGPQAVTARGSERRNSNLELIYEPPKVQLGQRIALRSEALSTFNPVSDTSTGQTAFTAEAQRQLELGSLGRLKWDMSHRESSASDTISAGAGAVTTLESQHRVMLEGQLKGAPVKYQADVYNAARDPGELGSESRSVQQIRIELDTPGKNRQSNLSYMARVEQQQRPSTGIDLSDIQNTLVWRFRPHPRLGSTVTYIQQDVTDNLLAQLSRSREYVDIVADYNLPGTGGAILVRAQHETQTSARDSNAMDGLHLTSALNLGKSAHVAFDYEARSFDSNSGGSNASLGTDFFSTGIRYDVQAGPELSFNGSWYQDVQLRDTQGYRYSKDRVFLQLSYRPTWNWQYLLTVNSGAESTRDLLAGSQRYDTSDFVRADVSFTF
jgi:hypothetical protein